MRFICIVFILLMPTLSMAAGFNCAKASSAIEKMICGNPEISRLDDDMSTAYKEAASKASDSAPLITDQKLWLKDIRNSCKDALCLKIAYKQRIAELRRWNEPAANDKDIFGNYITVRDNYIYNPATKKNEPVKTTDCLTIKKSKGSRIYFSFMLVGANGHTCSMDGEAVLNGSAYQQVADKTDPYYPKECTLKIRIKRNTIALEDANGGCKDTFCGVRAVIDGTEFGRRQKTSNECEQF